MFNDDDDDDDNVVIIINQINIYFLLLLSPLVSLSHREIIKQKSTTRTNQQKERDEREEKKKKKKKKKKKMARNSNGVNGRERLSVMIGSSLFLFSFVLCVLAFATIDGAEAVARRDVSKFSSSISPAAFNACLTCEYVVKFSEVYVHPHLMS